MRRHRPYLLLATIGAIIGVLLLGGCRSRPAPAPQQRSFASASAAATALAQAAQQDDTNTLQQIFGPGAANIASTGDTAHDRQVREQFAANFKQMHRLAAAPDGAVTLYVGAENWPFPVPLIQKAGQWQFDTAAGAQQILDRRIGRNENTVVEVCQQLVAAENDYHAKMHHFAQHFISTPGQRDGLFWSSGAAPDQPATGSPIGPLLAFASIQTSAKAQHAPTPFHGYFYRMLHGATPDGYAFVAFPAVYRSSGVMTFLVTQAGGIYQKNLGPDTPAAAKALTAAPVDSSWSPVK